MITIYISITLQEELYITGDSGYHANIYAYTDGEVKLIDGSFSGDYYTFKNTNLVLSTTAHSDASKVYKKFKNGKMTTLAEADGYVNSNGKIVYNKYKIKGKTVTAKKYKAYVNKLTKGKTKVKATKSLYKNTAENRSKYLYQ